MNRPETAALFNAHAPTYDTQWARMSPVRDALNFLLEPLLATLPDDAHILGVGVGTGAELAFLAQRFPRWRFTAVEPAETMLALCRQRAEAEGFAARCTFHLGFLETLAPTAHHAATCFLVSQFLLDPAERTALFHEIAARLTPGGILVNADLAADVTTPGYDALLRLWMTRMSSAGVPDEAIERARAAYAKDVAILPPERVASLIEAAGFERPVPFFQAALLQAWCARRGTRAMA